MRCLLLSLLLAADESKGESGVWEGKVVVGAWWMKDRTDKREFGMWIRKEEGKGDVGVFVLFLRSWCWRAGCERSLRSFFASGVQFALVLMIVAASEATKVVEMKTGTVVGLQMVAVCGCALLCIVVVVDVAFCCLRKSNGGGPVR